MSNKGKQSRPGAPSLLDSPNKELSENVRNLIVRCARHGYKQKDIAKIIGICEQTFCKWLKRDPELGESVRIAKKEADLKVEDALEKVATGWVQRETKQGVDANGNVIDCVTEKHLPPNTTALKFWLANRRKDFWKESTHIDHTTGGDKIDKEIKVIIKEVKADSE